MSTCRATVNIDSLLARREIQLVSGLLALCEIQLAGGKDFCGVQGCDQPSFRASGECSKHLFERVTGIHRFGTAQELSVEKKKALRETFDSAAQKQWDSPPIFDIVRRRTSEIERGDRPGSSLVILDAELSPASRQLWEFAMIERISGDVLINTCVVHEDGLDHRTLSKDPFSKHMSQSKAAAIYSPSRLATIDRMKADEIAFRLRKAGITLRTMILL